MPARSAALGADAHHMASHRIASYRCSIKELYQTEFIMPSVYEETSNYHLYCTVLRSSVQSIGSTDIFAKLQVHNDIY